MGREDSRIASIMLIAVAAVLAGVGNATGQGWLVAVAFGVFAVGAATFMRWRARRARVLDREEKTSRQDERR
jgi:hypothetical protein